MRKEYQWGLLAALVFLPLASMWLMPLSDTSEPRYAEISRLMVQSGDWITPWFEPGKPFWGKPPLSFWLQAISFKLFGVNEFAARLPSWLASLATAWLVYAYARTHYDQRTGLNSVIVYLSCALVYVMSGAVLTDPFLAFGTTLSMIAYAMAAKGAGRHWGYGFFLGLSIGLLAKGPLALILIAGPIAIWLTCYPRERQSLRSLPWFTGLLLTIVLSVPWYIAAELKTPGFLNYFIIGEHFLRFVDSGWQGDLYGTAHSRPHGTIWWYWVQAAFPWSLVAFVLLFRALTKATRRSKLLAIAKNAKIGYLLAWALFTPVFFTVSGNILWTYILPALAAFSLLMTLAVQDFRGEARSMRPLWLLGALAPLALLALTTFTVLRPDRAKTERDLVRFAVQHMRQGDQLVYLRQRPFSARFYSHGKARLAAPEQLASILQAGSPTVYLAVPKAMMPEMGVLPLRPNYRKLFENRRYVLLKPTQP